MAQGTGRGLFERSATFLTSSTTTFFPLVSIYRSVSLHFRLVGQKKVSIGRKTIHKSQGTVRTEREVGTEIFFSYLLVSNSIENDCVIHHLLNFCKWKATIRRNFCSREHTKRKYLADISFLKKISLFDVQYCFLSFKNSSYFFTESFRERPT